jgi:hypothetical protein
MPQYVDDMREDQRRLNAYRRFQRWCTREGQYRTNHSPGPWKHWFAWRPVYFDHEWFWWRWVFKRTYTVGSCDEYQQNQYSQFPLFAELPKDDTLTGD